MERMKRLACRFLAALTTLVVLASGSVQGMEGPPEIALEGRVLDAGSGAPVAKARVSAGPRAATTAVDGWFTLSLPPGAWTVEVSADGYLLATVKVTIGAEAPSPLTLSLASRARFEDRVEVTAAPDGGATRGPAVLPVRPGDVAAVAGGGENVFRTLQTLPGVAAADEFGSRLAVRGGGPDQNLTIMDGVEIHNPYRLFGLTSAFNPETVSSFELYAGGFSAKYGDRLSSLLVVQNRSGDHARPFAGSSALSLTDANVVLEGRLPGSRHGSWLVTGRRTYYDLVANRIVGTDLPAFADLQGKLALDLGAGRRLVLTGLSSRESANSFFEGDRSGDQGTFVNDASNDVAAATLATPLGSRVSSSTTVSFYRNVGGFGVDARFQNDVRRSNAPLDEEGFAKANVLFAQDLSVRDFAVRQELAWQATGRQFVEGGVEVHRLHTGVVWDIQGDRNPSEGNGTSIQGGAGLPDFLDSSYDSTRVGAWLLDRLRLGGRITIEPGVRVDYSGSNGRTLVSPRLSATLGLGRDTRLRLGLGRFTQSPGYEKLIQSDYFVDLSGRGRLDLESERAAHVLLGLERDFSPGFQVRFEGYYKTFDRLIVGRLESEAERQARLLTYDFPADLYSELNRSPVITTEPTNEGRGRAYGFDLYLARRGSSTSRLTGWASYTYGVARRQEYGLDFPFDYDRRHAVSLVGTLRLGPRFDLATTTRVASGFPRTPVRGLQPAAVVDSLDRDQDGYTLELVPLFDAAGRVVYTTDLGPVANLNSARLPVFARVDLRLTFRPRGAAGRWLFYLDVINATNRKNAGSIDPLLAYDPAASRPRIVDQRGTTLPLLPSFGVKFRF
jgi:Carboxypeptidase regulatory-like domain/TonB-dependent Receptor Plug Domain